MSNSLIGETIDGYRIVDVLGRGGMGTVYQAVDEALDKVVALKMMAPRLAEADTFLERFKAEAKALARLDAPGIVRVLALRETEQRLFIVMEYVEGPTLSTILRRHAPLDWTEALPLFRQMLEAIGHAHKADVLHRDLKPGNILVTSDGSVKITDFGLAKIQAAGADLTSTYETAGTLCYMSPEQIKGLRNVDERSDLFSLGLIVYEMLTGRLPFDRSASNYAIQRAIVEEPFPPPTTFRSDVPSELARVVQRMLAKDRSERFSDAASVRDALRPLEEQLTSPPSPRSWNEPERPPAWRRVALAAAFGVAGLLLLGGSFVAIRSLLQPAASSPGRVAAPTSLSVSSTPTGAIVRLNGDSVGTTPLDAVPLSSDSTTLRLTKASFHDFDTTLTATGDHTLNVSLMPRSTARETTIPSLPSGASLASSEASSGEETAPAAGNDSGRSSPSPHTDMQDGPTEAPRPASTGVLAVASDPSGAAVHVDGRARGTTPLTLPALDPGEYAVTVRINDHEPFQTTATLQAGDTLRLAPTLAPQPAVLRVRVIPYGSVSINGTPRLHDTDVALTDTLAPDTYQVSATYRDLEWTRSLTLSPGEDHERVIDFTQTFDVGVTVEATDGTRLPNAEVLVNGESRGYAPLQLSLRFGQHTITTRKPGFSSTERTVTVDNRLETPLVFRLQPEP